MTKRRRGQLSAEDRALWERVARTANRTKPDRRAAAAPHVPTETPSPKTPPAETPAPPAPFTLGSRAATPPRRHDLDPGPAARLKAQPAAVDKRTLQRMRRGKASPDARLDLHGMTLDAAQRRLTGFVLRAQNEGLRLCLVITGKGRRDDDGLPVPARIGALRHQVPDWLARPPLSSVVQQVLPAHQRHGGSGAYYVYLRRRR